MRHYRGLVLAAALLAAGCGAAARPYDSQEQAQWKQICHYCAGPNCSESGDLPAQNGDRIAALSAGETERLNRAAARMRAAVVAVHTRHAASSVPPETDEVTTTTACSSQGGSGVIVDGAGLILTSAHVVRGADSVHIRLADGSELAASEVTLDPRLDVAYIRVKTERRLCSAEMADANHAASAGALIHLGVIPGEGDRFETRAARIVRRDASLQHQLGATAADYSHLIETTAAIRAGFSGGPAIDGDGRLVGLNVAVRATADIGEMRSYLVPLTGEFRSRIRQLRTQCASVENAGRPAPAGL